VPATFDPLSLLHVLAGHGVEHVLTGGLAAVLHGAPVGAFEAEIVPADDPANLTRLGDALRALDARLRVLGDPDGVALDPHPALLAAMASLDLTTRFGDLDVRLTTAAGDDHAPLAARAARFEIDADHRSGGVIDVVVASLDDLIADHEAVDGPLERAVLPLLEATRAEVG
jgi:hypothetical protein